MQTLTINLTAPEVHPPQRITLVTDHGDEHGQYALVDGLTPNSHGDLIPNCTLATWISEGSGTLFLNLPSSWLWYLGWAFADIAREISGKLLV